MMKQDFPIESFRMTGVHGYKDISMVMKGKTTIFVSENGAGKTTILNALRLVLERDLMSLKQINFKSIFIKMRGYSEIEIKSDFLFSLPEEEIINILKKELSIGESFWEDNNVNKLVAVLMKQKRFDYRENELLHDLYMATPYPENIFNKELEKLRATLQKNDTGSELYKVVGELLSDNEIIFLPTYRRVEKNLDHQRNDERDVASRRWGKRREIKLHHDGISYGLKDVEDTLKEITLDIERTSNSGYRALSAKMLNDLIRFGNDQRKIKKIGKLPLIEDLERFLSRVDNSGTSFGLSSHLRRKSQKNNNELIDSLKSLYDENKVKEMTYLHYFLSQLDAVIQETKEQEYKIENFVAVCNKYLTSSGDSKSLQFDPQSLEVVVSDNYIGERISLNALSSGEKQVISLMAIIHLSNNSQKILLIDEPELSLSIEWQKMILPDLSIGENVNQIIAITHSPFIFDNELDNMATAMKVRKGGISA